MGYFLLFARLFRPSPATRLASSHLTGLASPLLSLPANHFARLLLVAVGAWLATACTSESSPEQLPTDASGSVSEATSEDSATSDDGNDECRKMQDMWDALPKLKTYKQFTSGRADCLAASGVISYRFEVKDNQDSSGEALMTVVLWDENRHDPEEKAFIKHAKELDSLTINPNQGIRKSLLGIGEIPTVSGYALSEKASGGKFVCLFKGHYYFEILVSLPGKSLSKPEAVESFVKEYVKQIDPSKLK